MSSTKRYINVNVFKPEFVNPEDKKLPIFVGERRMLVRNTNSVDAYNTLYDQLGTYMDKIPSSPAKTSVKKLYDRRLIFFGRDVTIPGKNGIVGSYVINRTKFAGVVLDAVELEINYETAETSNIDGCFYVAYYQFIRAVITLNARDVKKDMNLHGFLIKYLSFICLRLLGSNLNFNDKQKSFLEILCSYFFYRFLVGMNHKLTKETVYKTISKELQSEVDVFMSRLERYTMMKDIFKGLIDFGLTQETPAILVMRALTKFKPTVFYSFVSSLDYLIALSIISKYPTPIFSSAAISNGLQTNIENIVLPILNKTSFDITAVDSI